MEIDVNINCFQLPTLKYWSWKRPQERLWGDTDLGSNIACVRWYHLWACFLMWHGGWGEGCGRGPLAECACPAQVLCTASAVSRPCWGEVGRPDKSSSPAGLQGLRGAGAAGCWEATRRPLGAWSRKASAHGYSLVSVSMQITWCF